MIALFRDTYRPQTPTMTTLDTDFANGLLDSAIPPCLSLYQPTHRKHPDNQQDPIRFKNLLSTMEASLRLQHSTKEIEPLLAPFLALADDQDFWNHSLDGLAVLGSNGFFRVYKLQQTVAELVVVADSFHVKPLLRVMQSADRYHILGVSRKEFRFYEGNGDVLDELSLASNAEEDADVVEAASSESHGTVAALGDGAGSKLPSHHGHSGKEGGVDIDAERFFRSVDKQILAHHSHAAGLPLILATLPENRAQFHHLSHNPLLLEQGIDVYPDTVSMDELRKRAWHVVEPHFLARMAAQLDAFGAAHANALGGDKLADVAAAIVAGRVGTLLIEGDREIPGRIDATTGAIHYDDMAKSDVDDVLDDLGTMARKMGGKVVIVPTEQMPTSSGVAAIYRY